MTNSYLELTPLSVYVNDSTKLWHSTSAWRTPVWAQRTTSALLAGTTLQLGVMPDSGFIVPNSRWMASEGR